MFQVRDGDSNLDVVYAQTTLFNLAKSIKCIKFGSPIIDLTSGLSFKYPPIFPIIVINNEDFMVFVLSRY